MQSYQWYQAEQENADLVNAEAGVVNSVKGFYGKLEPAAMQAVKPVMSKNENDEPYDQECVVDQGRPDKEMQDLMKHI